MRGMMGLVLVAALAAAGAAEAGGPKAGGVQSGGYTFYTISAPNAPAGDTNQALAINDAGQVLVSALNNSWPDNVDINDVYNLHTGVYTPLPAYPGAVPGSTLANGINNSGVTAGQYDPGGYNPYGFTHGYSYRGGVFTTIDRNGLPLAFVIGISNNGKMTGDDGDLTTGYGFVYQHGVYSTFAMLPPDGNWTTGEGINDAGTIVGVYGTNTTGFVGSFIDVRGVLSPFAAPGWANTLALGINDKGEIVGRVANQDFSIVEGFIDDKGVFTYLTSPGSPGLSISGINNLGEVVGAYNDVNGNAQAFVAIPTPQGVNGDAAFMSPLAPAPEPATWAVTILGVAMVGFAVRRRREGLAFGA